MYLQFGFFTLVQWIYLQFKIHDITEARMERWLNRLVLTQAHLLVGIKHNPSAWKRWQLQRLKAWNDIVLQIFFDELAVRGLLLKNMVVGPVAKVYIVKGDYEDIHE